MNRDILRQFAVIFTTLFTLISNGAANALPLGGRNTGVISDSFNVLFVPAAYVFSIWGLIYLLLGAYVVYHSLPSQRQNPRLRRTGWLVAISSIANGAWIYLWHFGVASYIASLIAMLVLLATLITIYLRLDIGRAAFRGAERFTVALPFSVYLGWITVATIANITAVAAYLGWRGAPLSETAWTVIMLAAGVIVGGLMAFTRRDIPYLLVLVWAFVGISVRWANMDVLSVAGYIAAGLVVLALVAGRLVFPRRLAPAIQG
jgi:hypothetical protein